MRLFKLIVTFVILGLAALFIYQNLQTLTQPVGFTLNLYFFQINPEKTPYDLYLVILLAGLVGLTAGMALMLKSYFKVRRLLKRERLEKKQAEEAQTLRQARAESHGEALDPVPPVE